MKIKDSSVLSMSVTVPIPMPAQIGPCPIICKSGLEPKTPPKTLPKRKTNYQENHIYDTVPIEGMFFKKSYSPVSFPRKPVPSPPGTPEPKLCFNKLVG